MKFTNLATVLAVVITGFVFAFGASTPPASAASKVAVNDRGQCNGPGHIYALTPSMWLSAIRSEGVESDAAHYAQQAGYSPRDSSFGLWVGHRTIIVRLPHPVTVMDYWCPNGEHQMLKWRFKTLPAGWPVLVVLPDDLASSDVRTTPHAGYKARRVTVKIVAQPSCGNISLGEVTITLYVKKPTKIAAPPPPKTPKAPKPKRGVVYKETPGYAKRASFRVDLNFFMKNGSHRTRQVRITNNPGHPTKFGRPTYFSIPIGTVKMTAKEHKAKGWALVRMYRRGNRWYIVNKHLVPPPGVAYGTVSKTVVDGDGQDVTSSWTSQFPQGLDLTILWQDGQFNTATKVDGQDYVLAQKKDQPFAFPAKHQVIACENLTQAGARGLIPVSKLPYDPKLPNGGKGCVAAMAVGGKLFHLHLVNQVAPPGVSPTCTTNCGGTTNNCQPPHEVVNGQCVKAPTTSPGTGTGTDGNGNQSPSTQPPQSNGDVPGTDTQPTPGTSTPPASNTPPPTETTTSTQQGTPSGSSTGTGTPGGTDTTSSGTETGSSAPTGSTTDSGQGGDNTSPTTLPTTGPFG